MTSELFPYLNPILSIEERAADLVGRLTLDEKISQMQNDAPAIERLGIPAYNWWNECLHGVGRAGLATVFPQAVGLAATWNAELLHQAAGAIADEARAKYHHALREGRHEQYFGLTFWTPNINILRDPRWGRGQETYGEDPHLTARLAVEFITGLQGDHPRYLKTAACAKHFAVHSGPEHLRHEIDVRVSPKDLWETYLPAFEAAVIAGKVESVMGAYNRVNSEPCCASPTLLENILRQMWGFAGHVVSDCGAIADIFLHHRTVSTPEEAAALAVRYGCDLECGTTYSALKRAVEQGLIPEHFIDRSVSRLFQTRLKLGMFDPPQNVPYTRIPYDVVDCEAHRALALRAARESIVLLKNKSHFLPLDKHIKCIAVIGPNADDPRVLWGNYNGIPSSTVTPLQGVREKVSPQTEVLYAHGCLVGGRDTSGYAEASAAARKADVVIFVGGLSQWLEGEEGAHESVPDGEQGGGDRTYLALPAVQENLLKAIYETGTPVVLVLVNGGALAIEWADRHIPAILESWYGGQAGGAALADVLFGDYNPAGRLPVTFYKSEADLPPMTDYRMSGRTYRYFDSEVLYPFGHGLSYTTFAYTDLRWTPDEIGADDTLYVSADVTNTGSRAGDEVAQLYIQHRDAPFSVPRLQLAGFQRVHLEAGERRTVEFELTGQQRMVVREDGARAYLPGELMICVGGGQPIKGASYVSSVLKIT